MARCIGFDHTHTPHEFRSPGRSIETVAQQAFLPSQGLAAHPSTITWVLSVPLEPISSMSCINASAISPPHVLMVSPRHTFSFMTAPTSSADRPPYNTLGCRGPFGLHSMTRRVSLGARREEAAPMCLRYSVHTSNVSLIDRLESMSIVTTHAEGRMVWASETRYELA